MSKYKIHAIRFVQDLSWGSDCAQSEVILKTYPSDFDSIGQAKNHLQEVLAYFYDTSYDVILIEKITPPPESSPPSA